MRKTSWEFRNSELKTEADRKVWSHTSAFEHLSMIYLKLQGLLGMPQLAQLVKKPACQCKRYRRYQFSPWVEKIPCRRKWQPTPVSLPGKSHGQRSPGGLQFMGSQRGLSARTHAHTHTVSLSEKSRWWASDYSFGFVAIWGSSHKQKSSSTLLDDSYLFFK